jgi:hypothetical protein
MKRWFINVPQTMMYRSVSQWSMHTVTKYDVVKFEVFTAVTMKKAVFWDVAPCSSGVNRRFGGTYRLHLQGRRESIRLPLTSLTDASRADFLILSLLSWRWRRYVPLKRRLTPLLHGATSQKTAFFKLHSFRVTFISSLVLLSPCSLCLLSP